MKLHSQILGSGKPFLILHGLLGMGDNWKTLGNQWAEDGYEVHLLDLRNHGRSFHSEEFSYPIMAEDVKRYCEEHSLERIILLGHSMGGKVAIQFAATYPEEVEKLIIADIGPQAYPPHHQDILKALHSLDFSKIKSRGEAEDAIKPYIKDKGIRLFLLKNLYRKGKTEFGLRVNLPVISEKIEEVGKALPQKARYEGPTLFLRGERSHYIDEADAAVIERHFPRAEIKTVPNAGHWLHAENPEAFYALSNEFLRKE